MKCTAYNIRLVGNDNKLVKIINLFYGDFK